MFGWSLNHDKKLSQANKKIVINSDARNASAKASSAFVIPCYFTSKASHGQRFSFEDKSQSCFPLVLVLRFVCRPLLDNYCQN